MSAPAQSVKRRNDDEAVRHRPFNVCDGSVFRPE